MQWCATCRVRWISLPSKAGIPDRTPIELSPAVAIGIFVAVTLLFFAPHLFGGKHLWEDFTEQTFPFEAFAAFGSDLDAVSKAQLERGYRLVELLKQPLNSPMPVEEQVVSIFSGVRGYLDRVATNDVVRFEQGLLAQIRSAGADILSSIRDKREITPETEEKLKAFVEAYAKSFA